MKRGTKLVSNIRISDKFVDASIHVENIETLLTKILEDKYDET